MEKKLEARQENWKYLVNALRKGGGDERFRNLCEWFFEGQPTIVACAERAYGDLQRRLSGISKISESEKKEYKNKIYTYIDEQINELLDPRKPFSRSQSDFDAWHKNVCTGICEISECIRGEGIKFSYGHAQKWLNMTLKNMLVAETEDWWSSINRIRDLLHVPIDRDVIQAADFQLGIRRTGEKKERYISEKYISWSNWDDYDGEYMTFQNKVRDAIESRDDYDCPIDWEFEAWIAARD